MPTFKLGKGNDQFVGLPSGYYGELDVHGGSGNDYIDARGQPDRDGGSNVTVYGDSGNDTLFIGGPRASNSSAYGGGGSDILSASDGYQFTLDGGGGADILISKSSPIFNSPGTGGGEGTRMTGGSGRDAFVLNSNAATGGALYVSEPNIRDGAPTNGDVIEGLIDVITDYHRGELIDLPGTQTQGDVVLQTYGTDPWGWLHTETGEYGLVRGELIGDGDFAVAEDGPDVLLVYQQNTSLPVDGAVAILGGASTDLLIG